MLLCFLCSPYSVLSPRSSLLFFINKWWNVLFLTDITHAKKDMKDWQDQGVPGVDAKEATIHVTRHLENQNRGSTFAPPRWGHVKMPDESRGSARTHLEELRLSLIMYGQVTLIADLNLWNELIHSCSMESMGNSVWPWWQIGRRRLNKTPAKRMAGTHVCQEVVRSSPHDWQLIQKKESEREREREQRGWEGESVHRSV